MPSFAGKDLQESNYDEDMAEDEDKIEKTPRVDAVHES